MIIIIMHMRVSAEKRKELSQTITSLLSAIRKEEGCLRCDFFHSMENKNILCLLEEWNTQKNLEKHCTSKCFKVLRGAMNLLEMPCEISSYSSFLKAQIEEIGHPQVNKLKEPYNQQ